MRPEIIVKKNIIQVTGDVNKSQNLEPLRVKEELRPLTTPKFLGKNEKRKIDIFLSSKINDFKEVLRKGKSTS
jgi:hypothetical protein